MVKLLLPMSRIDYSFVLSQPSSWPILRDRPTEGVPSLLLVVLIFVGLRYISPMQVGDCAGTCELWVLGCLELSRGYNAEYYDVKHIHRTFHTSKAYAMHLKTPWKKLMTATQRKLTSSKMLCVQRWIPCHQCVHILQLHYGAYIPLCRAGLVSSDSLDRCPAILVRTWCNKVTASIHRYPFVSGVNSAVLSRCSTKCDGRFTWTYKDGEDCPFPE